MQETLGFVLLRVFELVAGALLLAAPMRSQMQAPEWQAEVRRYAEAQDWISAMRIVDQQAAAAPQDMDVRAWRARVLSWSGRLPEAEKEYLEILKFARNDPDDWMGLAGVYSREGKTEESLRALSRAVELDPKRADLHAARARALRGKGERIEPQMEFRKALGLDPTSAEAQAGLISLRGEPRQELRFSQDNDLFNFTSANHAGWVSLASQWTPRWGTNFAGSFYERAGIRAGKFSGGSKADAVNAGLNAANSPYVCVVDADSVHERDALLRIMVPILEDPKRVVAVGGIIRVLNGSEIRGGTLRRVRLPRKSIEVIQVIEYLRAFLIGREAWAQGNMLTIISGAFGLFRTDLVRAVGGYRSNSIGEDFDLVARLHRHLLDKGVDYQIRFVPDPMCWTEVPSDLKSLGRQRQRWQRGYWTCYGQIATCFSGRATAGLAVLLCRTCGSLSCSLRCSSSRGSPPLFLRPRLVFLAASFFFSS